MKARKRIAATLAMLAAAATLSLTTGGTASAEVDAQLNVPGHCLGGGLNVGPVSATYEACTLASPLL